MLSSLGQQAGGGGGEEGGAGAAQGSNRRALRHLSLCRCPKVTDGGLQALAAGVPQLETLRANMCDKVRSGAGRRPQGACAIISAAVSAQRW